ALVRSELAIVERVDANRSLFDGILDPGILAPGVEHASIAQRVGPAHARRCQLVALGKDRLGGSIDLEGINVALFAYADRFALALLDDVDTPKALGAVAAGKPEIWHFDAAFRAVDAQDIVEVRHHSAGDLRDDAVLEGEDGC